MSLSLYGYAAVLAIVAFDAGIDARGSRAIPRKI
jgi:hypothetical protein